MQVNLEWFEGLCMELTRNPVNATKTIELFRESDYAIEACTSFLQATNASHIAKFQAISILQYACLNRWTRLSKNDHDELKNISFAMVTHCVYLPSPPQYLLNKLIQVYVSFWKRSWLDCSDAEKIQFFHSIAQLLSSVQGRKAGVVILRTIVEEFSAKSFAEANLSLAHHIQIKTAFQGADLQRVFVMTVEFVVVVFQSLGAITNASDSNVEALLKTLAELLKLLTEVISWDFSDDGGIVNTPANGKAQAVQYSKLPREWATHLIQPSFIDNIYSMYRQLLLYRQDQISGSASPGGTVSDLASIDLSNCLLETRNLILCLSSINGPIFADPAEKVAMASYIVDYSIQLVENSNSKLEIGGPEITSLTITSPCYETGSTVRATLRHEEMELFLHTVYRLLNNFKVATLCAMPNFNAMLVTLMTVSYENAMEIVSISKDMLSKVEQAVQYAAPSPSSIGGSGRASTAASGSISGDASVGYLKSLYDTKILDTWRGDVLNSVLDIWSLLLEDPTILSILTSTAPSSPRAGGAAASNLNLNFKIFLSKTSQELYPVWFESLLGVYIFESFLSADEEIDEDDELIESRSVEDMLRGISVIGRVNFVNSSSILNGYLSSFTVNANAAYEQSLVVQFGININSEVNSLVILERLRICLLFVSYLLIENYHENSEDCEHESPTISELVLQSLASDNQQTIGLLHQTLSYVCDLLRFQVFVLCSGRGELLSPMVLQLVFRFLTEYTLRYVDVEETNYSREVVMITPRLTNIHGVEFNQVADLVVSAAGSIMSLLPLESDLIASICESIKALANTCSGERLQTLVQLPSVNTVAQIVMSTGDGQQGKLLLNAEGYVQVFEALGTLLVKANKSDYFGQVCTSVYSLLSASNASDARVMERSLASLTGLARCPAGLDNILHGLFDGSFALLKGSIVGFVDSDGTLLQLLRLVVDYSENQLTRLKNNSCFELYKITYQVLQLFAKRFSMQDIVFCLSTNSQDSVTLFKNDALLLLLELLNNLSNKDFSFVEDSSEEFNQSFETEVRVVLLYGFQMMSLIVNVEVLTNYPITASKYYSFVGYICTTYMPEIVQWANEMSPAEGKQKLGDLVQQLLWAVSGSMEGAVARQALQCLQTFAIHQHRCMQPRSKTTAFSSTLHNEVLLLILDRLLEVVLVPQEKDFDLSWDRVDALGGTLIAYITLDNARYQQVAAALVQRHTSLATQQILLENLTKVSTNRGVNMQSIEKSNRMLFVANFRDLVTQVKSLNLKK